MFHAVIVEAVIFCRCTLGGASHVGNSCPLYRTSEDKRATKLDNESYKAWLAFGSPATADRYQPGK